MTLQKYGEIVIAMIAEVIKENPDLCVDLKPEEAYIAGATTAMILLLETLQEH